MDVACSWNISRDSDLDKGQFSKTRYSKAEKEIKRPLVQKELKYACINGHDCLEYNLGLQTLKPKLYLA